MTHQALKACAGKSVLCFILHNAFREALHRNEPQGGVSALCEREREPPERCALIEHRPRVPPVGRAGQGAIHSDGGGPVWAVTSVSGSV